MFRQSHLSWVVALVIGALTAPMSANAQLRNFISDLYGGDGITLDRFGRFPHDAHFTESSLVQLNDLSDGISSSLGSFSFNSSVSGFTFDIQQGIPVRTTDDLGPTLAERAGTIGKGRINIAASYTNVSFDTFNDNDLDSLSVVLPHVDSNNDGILGPGPAVFAFEFDNVRVNIDATVKQDVVALYGNLGLTDEWDVGVVVPIVRVEARARAVATIVDQGGGARFHRFGSLDPVVSTSGGSETGIGDIVLRTKYNFMKEDKVLPDMAVIGQFTLPTGDEDDLLGTGETSAMAMFIASKQYGAITPHLNVGYELSTDSKRHNLRYVAGLDTRISKEHRVSAAASVLGRWYPNEVSTRNNFVDLALGVKWDPFEVGPLNASVIVPINNEGLRADIIWSVGAEYTF